MKVKCALCMNQVDRYCKVKKTLINLNKKRICDRYKFDEKKVKERYEIPSEMRPDWFWNRKELINKHKKEQKKIEEARKINPNYMPGGTFGHPLTGDLSRFVSTSNKEEK